MSNKRSLPCQKTNYFDNDVVFSQERKKKKQNHPKSSSNNQRITLSSTTTISATITSSSTTTNSISDQERYYHYTTIDYSTADLIERLPIHPPPAPPNKIIDELLFTNSNNNINSIPLSSAGNALNEIVGDDTDDFNRYSFLPLQSESNSSRNNTSSTTTTNVNTYNYTFGDDGDYTYNLINGNTLLSSTITTCYIPNNTASDMMGSTG